MVSTRRSQTRINHVYTIGAQVEILRSDKIEFGTLVRMIAKNEIKKASVSATAAKRWIVSIPGKPEEDIPEWSLGRVLTQSEVDKLRAKAAKAAIVAKGNVTKKVAIKHAKTAKSSSSQQKIRPVGAPNSMRKYGSQIRSHGGFKTRRMVPKPKKLSKDETVEEVKMLTGTLFLYRGSNPRAEFIRVV